MLLMLTSCAATGPATKPTVEEVVKEKVTVIDTACRWVKPIYPSRIDELTAGTINQILAHNKAVVAACGMPKTPVPKT